MNNSQHTLMISLKKLLKFGLLCVQHTVLLVIELVKLSSLAICELTLKTLPASLDQHRPSGLRHLRRLRCRLFREMRDHIISSPGGSTVH